MELTAQALIQILEFVTYDELLTHWGRDGRLGVRWWGQDCGGAKRPNTNSTVQPISNWKTILDNWTVE